MKGLFLLILLFPFSLFSQSFDIKDLGEKEKQLYKKVIEGEYCYRGCNDTIAKCLEKEDGKKFATRISKMVVRLIKKGKNFEEIKEAIKNRAKSLLSLKSYNIELSSTQCYGMKDGVKPLIYLVEYGDFQCPSCAAISDGLHKIVDEFEGRVVLCFKHFCLKTHPKALNASLASIAAEKQGKFWDYYFLLFKNRENLDMEDLKKYAQSLSLNIERFLKDMNDKDAIERIRKEKTEGLKSGINETPTIFLNNKKYYGIKTYDELKDFIEEMLEEI